MYHSKQKIRLLSLVFIVAIAFVGCGGDASTNQNSDIQKNLRTSTYINKGNFVEVASYAYKRVTDSSFTQETKGVSLPGNEKIAELSTYNITSIEDEDKLQKIIVQNHLNRLEVKLLEGDRVNILLQGSNFTMDRKMKLADFIVENVGR